MNEPHILILAAGQGRRMYSQLPKVLHEVLYRPMIHYVLDMAYAIPHQSVSIIVGHGEAEVREACKPYADLKFFIQPERKGTADAVRRAESLLSKAKGHVMVLSGDVMLLQPTSLQRLHEAHFKTESLATLMTALVPNPKGYGRIVRRADRRVERIREEADCSPAEAAINEVNAGIYVFEISSLLSALGKISDQNRQKEFYLTDVIELLAAKGRVDTCVLDDHREMTGINDRAALAEAEGILQARINRHWMFNGVTIQNPSTVFIDTKTRIEKDVVIEAGSYLIDCVVAPGVRIEAGCRLRRCRIEAGAHLKQGSCLEESEVGEGTTVGPYAHLRPGSRLGKKVKIGNFVEVKKSVFHDGAKASHLSYIGDADIGENVNLGCGFITCNYDGKDKHKTVIERDVFVGSDSQTVAPVTIGEGSYVASGSTVTENVPKDSLVLSRGKQVTKKGYAKKYQK